MKPLLLFCLTLCIVGRLSFPAYADDLSTSICQPITLPDESTTHSTPSPTASAIYPPITQHPDAALLREATLLLGEGDRLAEEGDLGAAREKWLESAELYSQTDEKFTAATVYSKLGDSYTADPTELSKLSGDLAKEVTNYYLRATLLFADVYEIAIRKDLNFNESVLSGAEAAYEAGVMLFEAGECIEATPLLEKARKLYAEESFGAGELRVVVTQIRCAIEQEDSESINQLSDEALEISSNLPLGDNTTSEQYQEGETQLEQGNYRNAIRILTGVRSSYSAQDIEENKGSYASVTNDLGTAYASLGDFEQAEALYWEALPLFIEVNNEDSAFNRGTVHHNLGNIYVQIGRYADAFEQYTLALTQWQAIGDPAQEVRALNGLSVVLMWQGDYTGALLQLVEAWSLQQRLPFEPEVEGDILTNMGLVYFVQGQYTKALDFHEQSLTLREQLSNPIKRIESINNIAGVQLNMGELDVALATYEDVFQFATEYDLQLFANRTQVNQALVFLMQGEYQEALTRYLQVQRDVLERGELTYATILSTTIGTTYMLIGDEVNAQHFLESGMRSADSQGALELSARSRAFLGEVLSRIGEFDQAAQCLEQAKLIFAHIGNPAGVTGTLNNQVSLTLRTGEFARAPSLANEAVNIAVETGNQVLEAESLLFLGMSYLANDEWDAAVPPLEQGGALAGAQGDVRKEAYAATLLSFIAAQGEDWQTADRYVRKAIEHLEQLQAGLTVGSLKTFLFEDAAGIYLWGAIVAANQNDSEAGFYRLEQARARALLDQIANSPVDLYAESDPALQEEANRQRLQLGALREQYKTLTESPVYDGESIQSLATLIREKEEAYATLRTQIEVQNPAIRALASTEVATVAEIQQLLDPQTTLISYFVDSNFDVALAHVISADKFSVHGLPASPEELTTALTTFRNDSILSNAHPDSLQKLYEWLITPLLAELNTEHLLIVPHADLHYLPFAALTNGEHYLSEQFVLSSLPSATALRYLETADDTPQSAFVIGNPQANASYLPPLLFAEQEAEVVASLFDSTLRTRDTATEATLTANGGQDIWHIAAHGEYNAANPLFSTIYLAPGEGEDGRLEVHEIYELDLETQLVVLSACETQVGTTSQGDDVVALNRAFLHAGVPAVIATLWPVDDEATAILMAAFYRNLKDGVGTARALQQAQHTLRADYPHPHYWAGFVLTGNAGEVQSPLTPTPTAEPSSTPIATGTPCITDCEHGNRNVVLIPIGAVLLFAVGSLVVFIQKRYLR